MSDGPLTLAPMRWSENRWMMGASPMRLAETPMFLPVYRRKAIPRGGHGPVHVIADVLLAGV